MSYTKKYYLDLIEAEKKRHANVVKDELKRLHLRHAYDWAKSYFEYKKEIMAIINGLGKTN